MSYILDALKKSEQERQQGNNPNLQSIHRPQLHKNGRGGVIKLLLIAVTLMVFTVLCWEYLRNITFEPVVNSALATQQKTSANVPVINQTEKQTAVADKPNKMGAVLPVIEFWQLPDPVQKAIPPLTFSFHVYSDNPERRTIIINNRRVREGNRIDDQLQLVEITKNGVVLDWNQHRFHIGVVENW